MDEYADPRDLEEILKKQVRERAKAQEVDSGANSRQIGGSHYKTGGEEHWDRVNRLQLDYFQGQITKYVERWKKKNGIEDLRKARHFLDKYIEIEERKGSVLSNQAVKVSDPLRGSLLAGQADKRYVDQ